MCGIYGITSLDNRFIDHYMKICEHRGPDASSMIQLDNLTLGHNLLSIMADPSKSTQPWCTPNKNYLVYNGEVFNYEELKKRHKDFIDTTGCDTELLAWGLDRYGVSFIDEIDSMHGFAYYEKSKKQLILSRDHAGIKPLYYAEISEGLVFGSEIKGMLDKVPGSRQIDRLAASFWSRTGCNPLRNTLFSGIKQLLPGETLVYDITKKKFIDHKRIYIRPTALKKFNAEEFREQVRNAVNKCSIGIRKIGVFLSGGMDSSMVAYELGKLKRGINTFTNRMDPSITEPENYNSDADAAKVLADTESYTHREVKMTPEKYMQTWDDSVYFMEQPVTNPSMAMYCYTNKVMSDQGIVITIAGDMGDELLAGYPKYQKMFFDTKHTPASWRQLLQQRMDRLKRPTKIIDDLLPDEVLLDEFEKCYTDALWNDQDPVGSYMALDCVTQVPADFLSRNDRYGMAYSMEGRFPLACKSFMQYCLSIQTKNKLNTKNTKIL